MKIQRSLFAFYSSALLLMFFQASAIAQGGRLDVTYTVALADPAERQFHVTTEIKNINQPRLELALPTWTPGWYVVENYGKNVLRFTVRDAQGKWVQPRMVRKQTWSVDTRGIKELKVEYDYSATVLGLNQAKIGDDYAFFTGIQLFLEPVGHKNVPSRLKLQVPAGWKLVSPLKESGEPNTFIAADYDTLVDAPAMMGRFDMTEFEVEGKPHYFTAYPAGTFSEEKSKRFTEMLAAAIKAQSAIFGGLPYEKYAAIYFFQPAESNASGALEHLNSYVAFAPQGANATPEQIIGTASHEFFHLWNVKRLRPEQMWPYDYSREQETPLLWFSEGFTNYYGVVATYRAGVTTREHFLNRAAAAVAGVENDEARKYIPPASASVSTWLGYDTPQAFTISYYTQGQNIAALLDLSIRNDTSGAASLDDVFRSLYNDEYKKGSGFTTEELLAVVNRLTKKNYSEFFDRYVFGVDVPDYDRIFGYAGYRLTKTPRQDADFGFFVRPRNGGYGVNGVTKGGAAERAGLEIGDVITRIDGTPVFSVQFSSLAGKDVKLSVVRDGTEIELPMKVGSREILWYALEEVASPTAAQLKVREGWLARTPTYSAKAAGATP